MKQAWLNGRLCPVAQLQIDPADRGFTLGDGLFETMNLHQGRVLRLWAHLSRLAEGAALLHLPMPGEPAIRHALTSLITANGETEGALRLTLTRGAGPRGIIPPASPQPTLLITQAPRAAALPPCALHISRYRRDGASPLSRVKHLNYLPQILSRIEAQEAGADDALLLSSDNLHIAEASAASLIVLQDERLLTPPLMDGALPGTVRAALIEADLCHEFHLTTAFLMGVDAAWLVSSLSIREVRSVAGHALPLRPDWTARLNAALLTD